MLSLASILWGKVQLTHFLKAYIISVTQRFQYSFRMCHNIKPTVSESALWHRVEESETLQQRDNNVNFVLMFSCHVSRKLTATGFSKVCQGTDHLRAGVLSDCRGWICFRSTEGRIEQLCHLPNVFSSPQGGNFLSVNLVTLTPSPRHTFLTQLQPHCSYLKQLVCAGLVL